MKKIFSEISNPYSIENFKRLLDLYLDSGHMTSEGRNEFYKKVVSYNYNRDIDEPRTEETNELFSIPEERFAKSPILSERKSNSFWYETGYFTKPGDVKHRIYINSSLDVTKQIVEKFMKECEDGNIPFMLKYAVKPHKRNDGIVISSDTPFFKRHIEILRKIAKENPELIEKCGTPHLLTANLDNWMGIADECDRFMTSYTQNMLDIFDISFKKFLINNPEISHKLGADESLESYIYDVKRMREKMYSPEKIEKRLSSYFSLKDIKSENLINVHPYMDSEKIEELYNIFLSECMYKNLDLTNPAFKADTREHLISIDEDEKGLTEEYIIKIAKEMEVARERYNAKQVMYKLMDNEKQKAEEIDYDDF